MGLFGSRKERFDPENIVSAVLIEQTQLYRKQSSWGVNFGNSVFGSPMVMEQTVPNGTRLKFSVTYRDGRKEIIEAMSGTEKADILLQKAADPTPEPAAPASQQPLFTLQKNQLPCGTYLIGQDIPAGTYDFTCVFGSGSLNKYTTPQDTTLGNVNYFQNMGTRHDYEYRQCLHVECKAGERLDICGNLVVGIAKSAPVQLDL